MLHAFIKNICSAYQLCQVFAIQKNEVRSTCRIWNWSALSNMCVWTFFPCFGVRISFPGFERVFFITECMCVCVYVCVGPTVTRFNTIYFEYVLQDASSIDTIMRTIKIKQQNITLKSNTEQQQTKVTKYVTLTYNNDKTHNIAQTFRKLKYKVAYKTERISIS